LSDRFFGHSTTPLIKATVSSQGAVKTWRGFIGARLGKKNMGVNAQKFGRFGGGYVS
jgi:hypothetical protein